MMSDLAKRVEASFWKHRLSVSSESAMTSSFKAALASLSPGDRVGPDGAYVVVPVEPTREMKAAAVRLDDRPNKSLAFELAYRAALASLSTGEG